MVGSAETFFQTISPVNTAKILFAAVLLGGSTLDRLTKYSKNLEGETVRAISRKLYDLLKRVDGWDEALSKFVAHNLYRFRSWTVKLMAESAVPSLEALRYSLITTFDYATESKQF